MSEQRPAALILAGGLALGAYQAGAFAVLDAADAVDVVAVAGSSIGAMNAAVIAGNAPATRAARLTEFWKALATEAAPAPYDLLGFAANGSLRHATNWVNTLSTKLGGVPGFFHPRIGISSGPGEGPSFYETSSAVATLTRFIDFDRLNGGEMRCCIATTDVESAETVIFDTAAGDRIAVEHLLASGGLLPSFRPVRIGGRLLADGGLSANAPLELLLTGAGRARVPLAFLLDLFAPDGLVPDSIEKAAARASALQFAAQTMAGLRSVEREHALRDADGSGMDVFHLSFRPSRDEAGPDKQFDFSRATLADRIAAGRADADEALRQIASLSASERGLRVHKVRQVPAEPQPTRAMSA